MARSKKDTPGEDDSKVTVDARKDVEDAEIVEPKTDATEPAGVTEEAFDTKEPSREPLQNAEIDEPETAGVDPSVDAEGMKVASEAHDPAADEPVREVAASETVPPAPPPPAGQSGGAGAVIPLIIGGIIAALIGFVAARYYDASQEAAGPTPAENAEALAVQTARLDTMQTSLEGLAEKNASAEISAAVDPLKSQIGGVQSETQSRLDDLSGQLAALGEKIDAIAARPVAEGVDTAAFDKALTEFRGELRSAVDEANAAIGKANAAAEEANKKVTEANAEIAAVRAEAERVADDAKQAEQAATARAAWSQVQAALDNGTS